MIEAGSIGRAWLTPLFALLAGLACGREPTDTCSGIVCDASGGGPAGGGSAAGGSASAGGEAGTGGMLAQGGSMGSGGEEVGGPVPDFSLLDVNATSPTHGTPVSPKDYLMQVSAWYFAHAT